MSPQFRATPTAAPRPRAAPEQDFESYIQEAANNGHRFTPSELMAHPHAEIRNAALEIVRKNAAEGKGLGEWLHYFYKKNPVNPSEADWESILEGYIAAQHKAGQRPDHISLSYDDELHGSKINMAAHILTLQRTKSARVVKSAALDGSRVVLDPLESWLLSRYERLDKSEEIARKKEEREAEKSPFPRVNAHQPSPVRTAQQGARPSDAKPSVALKRSNPQPSSPVPSNVGKPNILATITEGRHPLVLHQVPLGEGKFALALSQGGTVSKERLTTLRLVMATIKSNAQAARADEKTRTPHLRQILPYDKTELSGATHYFVVAGEPSAALVNHIVTAVKSQLKLEKK